MVVDQSVDLVIENKRYSSKNKISQCQLKSLISKLWNVALHLLYMFNSIFVLDMRLRFLTLLMLVVLIISLIITVMRFGVGILEDNFVAQLSTNYNSSAQFMSFYGLLNFYLYTMAYVYSPGNRPFHGELFAQR